MRGIRAALLLIGIAGLFAFAGVGAAKVPAKTPFLGLVRLIGHSASAAKASLFIEVKPNSLPQLL